MKSIAKKTVTFSVFSSARVIDEHTPSVKIVTKYKDSDSFQRFKRISPENKQHLKINQTKGAIVAKCLTLLYAYLDDSTLKNSLDVVNEHIKEKIGPYNKIVSSLSHIEMFFLNNERTFANMNFEDEFISKILFTIYINSTSKMCVLKTILNRIGEFHKLSGEECKNRYHECIATLNLKSFF